MNARITQAAARAHQIHAALTARKHDMDGFEERVRRMGSMELYNKKRLLRDANDLIGGDFLGGHIDVVQAEIDRRDQERSRRKYDE